MVFLKEAYFVFMDYLVTAIEEIIQTILTASDEIIKKLSIVKGQVLAEKARENTKQAESYTKIKSIIKFSDITQNNNSKSNIGNLEQNQKTETNDDENLLKEGDNITGSVSLRKDGRWMGRFYFQGKRYYVYDKTKTGCINKIREKRKELKEQVEKLDVISNNMKLNTWFDYYYETYKKQKVKNSTYLKLNEIYDRYVRNNFGNQKVNGITSLKLQTFINSITAYSMQTKIVQIFKELFEVLQKEGLIKRDPMNLVVLPKKSANDEAEEFVAIEEKILSYEDEIRFLNTIKKTSCYHPVKFILYTGLRRGECLGLRWKDIDLESNTITISQQYNTVVGTITSPKTKAAYRKIPILPEAKEIILELLPNKKNESELVFPKSKRLTKQVCYYASRANIHVNPHILRHTFASRCYAAGIDPKQIQKWLGHETITTTLDTYTHILEDSHDKVIINRLKETFKNMGYLD